MTERHSLLLPLASKRTPILSKREWEFFDGLTQFILLNMPMLQLHLIGAVQCNQPVTPGLFLLC